MTPIAVAPNRDVRRRWWLCLISALPLAAAAHTGHGAEPLTGFGAGLAHPLTGIDHLLAMVAVGLWSALAMRRLWVAPLAFACVFLVAAIAAMAGFAPPLIEPLVAASLVGLGLLVATRARLPWAAGAAIAGGFAVFHGAAHGTELDGGTALAGMMLATLSLHLLGVAIGLSIRARSIWLPRLAGAGILLYGAVLFAG
jgi:urease accessory protein